MGLIFLPPEIDERFKTLIMEFGGPPKEFLLLWKKVNQPDAFLQRKPHTLQATRRLYRSSDIPIKNLNKSTHEQMCDMILPSYDDSPENSPSTLLYVLISRTKELAKQDKSKSPPRQPSSQTQYSYSSLHRSQTSTSNQRGLRLFVPKKSTLAMG